jgi:DNA invertase Pin-like site-specific DNA recombinase
MTTMAYLRVSTAAQEANNQRLAILEFARTTHVEVHEFLEIQASSRRSATVRQLDVLLSRLGPGDALIVSELSRLGRAVGEIITTVDILVKRQIRVFALKEGLRLAGGQDLQSRVTVALFGLFAEIERELLSLRTKEALAAARAAGKRLGRPPGAQGKSKLDQEHRGNPSSTARSGRFKRSWISTSPRPLSRRSRGSTAQRSPILCGREG